MTTIPVQLGARSYDVLTGANLLSRAGDLVAPFAKSGRVFVVTDNNVAAAHLEPLIAALSATFTSHAAVKALVIAPGEQAKSFAGLEALLERLLIAGVNRNDLIVAFGGGVIGDLAGLAAGLVKRGVDFVQIPTTLLAQVDSSVGGKTAIDTGQGKNLIGLIHQPRLVIADSDVLTTLPDRELRAGYAEIVKIGLIGAPDFFRWCDANVAKLLAREPDALAHAIATSIAFKARVVEADETEQGERALLNLGHTFAHALEGHAGYDGALLHGEAVAAGMNLAFKLSALLGVGSETDADRVSAHLANAGFVTDLHQLPGAPFDVDTLMSLVASDKKAEAGKLTFVLARGIGRAFIEKDTPADVVRELLQQETK